MTTHTLDFQSSAFWRVMWDDKSLNLYIVFSGARGAPQYVYPGVGEDLIAAWKKAGSKGSYFHAYIKPLGDPLVRVLRSKPGLKNFFNPTLKWAPFIE